LRTLAAALPAALAVAGALADAPAALGQPAPADTVPACGTPLSGPIFQKWTEAGGQSGRLGCPSGKEERISPGPSGSSGRKADFSGGAAIVWHASGPHAGQTYIVQGCFWRLYAQYGGGAGWLGLPVGDAENNPDGQTQAFEGGRMTYHRADRNCEAEHGAAAAPEVGAHDVALDQAQHAPLILYLDPTRQEYFTSAQGLAGEDQPERYQQVRIEGYVFAQHPPGTVPLRAYWNASRGDHLTVGTAEGERAAVSSGYDYAGAQGFVFPDPRPGTHALKLYWSTARQDFLLVGTPEGDADAKTNGYDFVRVEGYALDGP
ncbi:MAG TPA: hypothetical protein VG939_16425, partial [Caulobacteraceae bacterium]|nr:hypothetical protein [Caulobacteraceae bacterium]